MKPGSNGFTEWLAYEKRRRARRRRVEALAKDALAVACTLLVWAWLCGQFGWVFNFWPVLSGAVVGVCAGNLVWAKIERALNRRRAGKTRS